ncbi:protein FAR-RED IMPAIRED RESPONSE 1-like [Camellia sinensis]|uniref:protein FAR-RED IMPAIRED RESPONSE 1-like n=1 Tax=Camellia sinensis TaxID=4442 RepID=UPI0010360804|nr:protein FAR-RED IMPAIRED RESPONSE 1-like [Camellia sinensis]
MAHVLSSSLTSRTDQAILILLGNGIVGCKSNKIAIGGALPGRSVHESHKSRPVDLSNDGCKLATEFGECPNLNGCAKNHNDSVDAQAYEVNLADDFGIKLKSSYEFIGTQADERDYLDYTKQDHKNYLQSKRQRDLQYGEEVWAILWHFENLSLENPSFYYAVQLDAEEQISNMFWADAQMIIDYSHFGDVLSFDMTYRTDKEYQPVGTKIYFLYRTYVTK